MKRLEVTIEQLEKECIKTLEKDKKPNFVGSFASVLLLKAFKKSDYPAYFAIMKGFYKDVKEKYFCKDFE